MTAHLWVGLWVGSRRSSIDRKQQGCASSSCMRALSRCLFQATFAVKATVQFTGLIALNKSAYPNLSQYTEIRAQTVQNKPNAT